MSGYTQSELQTIFAASGVDSDAAQRRLASLIIQAYVNIGVIRVVSTTGGAGAPLYNYNTRKYMAAMAKPLIDLATACYGQNYTPAEITALAQTEPFGPFSYSFATYAPSIVYAIFGCMEQGSELLTNGSTFATTWTATGDFAVAGSAAVYTDSAHSGTLYQNVGDMTSSGAPGASQWFVFDYEVTSASTLTGGSRTATITTSLAAASQDILTSLATAGKYSVVFKGHATQTALTIALASTTGGAVTLDNFSLRLLTNSAFSTNQLSNFTATQELYYQSFGSNYCKRFIAGVVTTTLQKMAEGEYSVYGTLNKQAEPVLDYYTT